MNDFALETPGGHWLATAFAAHDDCTQPLEGPALATEVANVLGEKPSLRGFCVFLRLLKDVFR